MLPANPKMKNHIDIYVQSSVLQRSCFPGRSYHPLTVWPPQYKSHISVSLSVSICRCLTYSVQCLKGCRRSYCDSEVVTGPRLWRKEKYQCFYPQGLLGRVEKRLKMEEGFTNWLYLSCGIPVSKTFIYWANVQWDCLSLPCPMVEWVKGMVIAGR